MSRDPGGGEGQEPGRRKRRARAPRPSPSQLSPQEATEQAHSAALRLLSHRERSRVELRSRLGRKGFDALTIDQVLLRLAEAGLQSDERFAATFTLEAHRNRGLSTNAVQGELRRRGIDRQLAAEAATERPEDEEARARDLAERRAARMTGLSPEVRARRLLGYLARRGYPPELCRRLAAEAAQGPAVGGPAPDEDRVP